MKILEDIESIYEFFKENDIDTNIKFVELDYTSPGFQKIYDFNIVVMEEAISEKQIAKILYFLQKRKDNITTFILDILLTNTSFIKNENVKLEYHNEIEKKIFDDIDDFNLIGEKLKVIDLFYDNDFDKIRTILDSLDQEDKSDIFMFIMEHTYNKDAINPNTKVGILLNDYSELINEIYSSDISSEFEDSYDDDDYDDDFDDDDDYDEFGVDDFDNDDFNN